MWPDVQVPHNLPLISELAAIARRLDLNAQFAVYVNIDASPYAPPSFSDLVRTADGLALVLSV